MRDFHSFRFVTPVDATTDAGSTGLATLPAIQLPHRHPQTRNDSGGNDDPPDLFCRDGAAMLLAVWSPRPQGQAQQAYGRTWGHTYNTMDWERFYHYPYVYYPQNYWGNEYYRSADSLYYRYPAEMRIPVYNRHWFSDYPTPRPYYKGAHFVLDIF